MNNKELLIDKNNIIIDALKQLDKTGKKILFVVDNNKLIGSLSDGDVRRYILKTGKIEGKVEEVCNKNTFKSFVGEDKKRVIEKAKILDIKYIPVVTQENEIVEFIVLEEINFGSKIETIKPIDIPVVIMAGGFGTRLEPFTKVLPKPLVPIGDKTILEIIMEKFSQYGIDEFWLSLNYKAYIIKSYLSELNLKYSINYIQEEKPLGTAGSLYMLKGKIKNKNFILTNCDIIIDIDFIDLLDHHEKNNIDITLVSAIQKIKIPYGVCKLKNEELTFIDEKPELSFLVNTGMYIMKTELLDLIPENEFFNATDLIMNAKKIGKKVGVFPIDEENWIDIGQWDEYKKAIKKY